MQAIDEETKYHKVTSDSSIGGRMYEEPGSSLCPVAIFCKYVSHLNPCERLFQRPKYSFYPNEMCWYQNRQILHRHFTL